MKKIVSLALLSATTSVMAINADYTGLYKDPRIMGMGGVNVAIGGYNSSVFSNPAGLMSIPKKDGFVVDLFNIAFSASKNFANFKNDFDDAQTDSEKSDLLAQYSGEHMHIGMENYFSISKLKDKFIGTFGVLTAVDFNFMAHGNGSRSGNFLETSSRVYGGIVLGGAMPFETKYGYFDLGASLKIIKQNSYEGTLGVTELTENVEDTEALMDELKDKYESVNTGVAIDIGFMYHLEVNEEINKFKPILGLSILNIGNMDFDAFGGQPLTVNVGASVILPVPHIEKIVIGMDYVDLFNANRLRVYDASNADNKVEYSDFEDTSFMKRFRIGTSLHLVDNSFLTFILNAGLYQSEFTTGIDMRLGFININATTYAEEVGTTNYSTVDRRYMVKLGLAW